MPRPPFHPPFAALLLALSLVPGAARAVQVADLALPAGVRDLPYPAAFTLTATAGTPPYTWAVTAGALPPGLVLAAGGSFTGTPTATGSYTATYRVTDGAGAQASKALALTVILPPAADDAAWARRGKYAGYIEGLRASPNIATDNTLYAWARFDDLYRSTNRGASWTRILLPATAPVLGDNRWIRTVALSPGYRFGTGGQPLSETTLYAVSQDILRRSSDHGATWTALRGDHSRYYIYSLALSPNFAVDNTLWIIEHDQVPYLERLYRSTDRGSNFTLVYEFTGTTTPGASALTVSPNFAADSTLFLPMWNGDTAQWNLYKSINGGASWAPTAALQTDDAPRDIAFSPGYASDHVMLMSASPQAAGNPPRLYRTVNAGASWTVLTSPLFATKLPLSLQYDPRTATPRRVYAFSPETPGRYAVLRSEDHGTTWVPLPGFNQRNDATFGNFARLAAAPTAAGGNSELFFGSLYGIDRSVDDGLSYAPGDNGVDAVYYDRPLSASGNFAGTTMAGFKGWFKSADAGDSWVNMPGVASGSGSTMVNGVRPFLPPNYALDRTLFLGWSDGLYRSTNGGASSARVLAGPYIRSASFAGNFRASGGTLFVGSVYGLHKSVDGGLTFVPVSSAGGTCVFPTGSAYFYSEANVQLSPNYAGDQTLFAALYDNLNAVGPWLCRSTDGGVSWSRVMPDGDYPYTVALPANFDNRAANGSLQKLVLAGGYGWLRRSTDGGASFAAVASIPAGVSVYAVAISPNFTLDGTVLAGTTYGVYRSADFGATFAPLGAGDALKYRNVAGIYLQPGFDGRLNANSAAEVTTFGGGMWRSADGGRTFLSRPASELVSRRINAAAVVPGGAAIPIIHAASEDHGMLRSDDGGLTFGSESNGLPADSDMRAAVAPIAQPARPIAARAADGLWRYDNAAGSWARHSGAGSGDYRAFGEDGAYLYAMRRDGVSLRSSDGGATWSAQDASKTDLVSVSQGAGGSAPVVGDGDFEQPALGAGQIATHGAGQAIGGWTVESGSVDLLRDYWQAADGEQSLDLSGIAAGAIRQDLATTAGASYTLSFSLAANPDTGANSGGAVKELEVWWNGALLAYLSFDRTGHSRTNMGWTQKQYTVTATGTTTRLRFVSLSNSYCGAALDAVAVTRLAALADPGETPNRVGAVAAPLWSASAGQGPMFSYDNGAHWTAAPGGNDYALPGGQSWQVVQALGINAASGGREVSAGSASGLFLTRDGGETWRRVDGAGSGLEGTAKNYTALLSTPTAYGTDLLVGVTGATNGGVYLSGDGGEHWTQVNQGFDPAQLSISTLAKSSCAGCPVQYYSGSYGGGLYTRTITVVPPPTLPAANYACWGSTVCACATTPGSGPVAGGQPFKICGSNFQNGLAVEFDGVAASGCTQSGGTVITCTGTPAHVAGYASVRVRNPDTRVGALPAPYQFTGGASRTVNSLRAAKSGANANLTWSCAGCTAGNPGRLYRAQNSGFTVYLEQYDVGTASAYSNTGALGSAQSYFWSVE